MNAIYCLVVSCLTITKLCVCEEFISGTTLTYDTNYFIRQSSNNNYLRWDGNTNGDVSGLAYVTQTNLTNSTDESLIRSYIFVIERDVNSMIKIKSVVTNRYISYHSSAYGFVLANSNAYNNSLRLVNYGNSLNIVSANASPIIYLYTSDQLIDYLRIYTVHALSGTAVTAAYQFISAPNITESLSSAIGDTELKYGSKYFIQKPPYGTEITHNFLRWDGNNNGDIGGLAYVTNSDLTNIRDEAIIRSYIFVIERDVNSMIKIKNVLTNRYISYYSSSNVFVLSNSRAFNNSFLPVIHASSNSLSLLLSGTELTKYLNPYSAFKTNIWMNTVSASDYLSKLQFITAPSITAQLAAPVIGDTNLTFGNNYFIKPTSYNSYLRWDGNSNGDVSGLIYDSQNNITNIKDEAEKESYLFVIEPDVYNMIKLRNVRTNLYLTSYQTPFNGFALSSINNNSHSTSIRLLIDPAKNSIYLVDPTVTNEFYVNTAHAISSALYLYYIERTFNNSLFINNFYFQFISSTQPSSTTTT